MIYPHIHSFLPKFCGAATVCRFSCLPQSERVPVPSPTKYNILQTQCTECSTSAGIGFLRVSSRSPHILYPMTVMHIQSMCRVFRCFYLHILAIDIFLIRENKKGMRVNKIKKGKGLDQSLQTCIPVSPPIAATRSFRGFLLRGTLSSTFGRCAFLSGFLCLFRGRSAIRRTRSPFSGSSCLRGRCRCPL